MKETITLKDIFGVLKKRLFLIFSLIMAAAVISGVISYFVLTPTYQASSQFIVNQNSQTSESPGYDVNQIRSSVEIINTYNVIIKSPTILEQVAEELGLALSAGQLSDKLAVSSAENSQVVTVTATDTSQEVAAAVANKTVEVFQKKVPDLMNVNNVSILSAAEVLESPQQVSPKPLINIVIAVVIGAMAGTAIAFLLEYLDNTIKSEADVEDKLNLPVLGVISHVGEEELKPANVKKVASAKLEGGEYNGAAKKTI